MRILKIPLFILGIYVVYFLTTVIATLIIQKNFNKIEPPKSYEISQSAIDLYNNLDFVGDLHCDALLWKRDLSQQNEYGHVDFPRMQKNNVSFQAFTIVTKTPKGQNFNSNSEKAFDRIKLLSIIQRQPLSTWFSLFNRAIYQTKKLHDFAIKFDNKFIVIKSKKDIETLLEKRAYDQSYIGGLLGIEGSHCLEGNIENFQKIYDAGVRMLGPVHFFDNELGGSAHGMEKQGLTQFGFEVLKEMEKKNMIIDLAHSSDDVIDDVLKHYNGPILSSHTGVDGTFDSNRNLSDKQLKGIAKKDGLIGIAFFSGAIGNNGIIGIVEAMKYTKELIGAEYIALGSDFDGTVTTPFDVTGYPFLVEEMLRKDFTPLEIKGIMGENLKQFMLKNLP